jgi:DNA polymerase-3 subunit beta
MNRKRLLEAVNLVSIFASPKTRTVRFHYRGEDVELSASDPDRGEGASEFPVAPGVDKRSMKAGFNYGYLVDAVKLLGSDEVGFYIVDALSPFVMWAQGRPEYEVMVMPMRL